MSTDDQEKTNDDLLYDPDEEEEDEKWMTNERLKYIHLLLFSLYNFYFSDLEELKVKKNQMRHHLDQLMPYSIVLVV